MTRVCLVTDELQPLTDGGIGRLLRNLLDDAVVRHTAVEFHLLFPRSRGIAPERFRKELGPGVRVHLVDLTQDGSETVPPPWDDGCYAPPAAFRECVWHGQSYQLAQELRRLEREGLVFDVIEFPDFRGWALCTLQEKRLGRAFQRTEITVRLHSAYAVIQHFEADPRVSSDLLVRELERQALAHADRVVAHLEPVAEFNRPFFGSDARWRERVQVEFPPVLPPSASGHPAPRARIDLDTPLVFPSRTNPFKRPHLFVQAAAEVMRRRPDYRGRAFLACHVFHPDYLRSLLDGVPPDLRERFVVLDKGSPERAELLARGICVVPSIYESLNLVAYEISAAGGVPVVNERCLAFGPGTPFTDGLNCLKFDGTVDGLVDALLRALAGPALVPIAWEPTIPYWERPAVAARSRHRPRPRLVSVIVAHRDAGAALAATLQSVAASTHDGVEVLVVDDGSRDAGAAQVLEAVGLEAARGPENIRLFSHVVPRGRAAAWNTGAAAARGDLMLCLAAGDRLSTSFLAEAAGALDDPALAGVLPGIGFFDDDPALEAGRFAATAVSLSEVPGPELFGHPAGLRPLWRRAQLPDPPFDELLDETGPWTAILDLALRGRRILASPVLGCFVPSAGAGMPLSPAARGALLARAGAGLATGDRSRSVEVTGQALATYGLLPLANPARPERPFRYDVADGAHRALRRLPLVCNVLREPVRRVVPPLPIDPQALGLWSIGTAKPLRYELIDWAYLSFKQRAPAVGPLVKRALRRLRG